jgi:thiamine transport system ATP-binding protein
MDVRFDGALIRRGGFALSADWAMAPGEAVALIGPSGGGKSTVLAAIAGFVPLAGGSLRIGGQDMAGIPPGRRPVTLLFQEHNLFPHLTVAQNVGLGLRPDLRLAGDDRGRVQDALAAVDLPDLGGRLPQDLSGGQRSRVAIARALLRDRPVLLLDEPFAALGPRQRREMLALVARIRAARGMTLLLVTHHPEEARAAAPRTVLVAGGVAHAPVPTADLLDDPPPALRDYL